MNNIWKMPLSRQRLSVNYTGALNLRVFIVTRASPAAAALQIHILSAQHRHWLTSARSCSHGDARHTEHAGCRWGRIPMNRIVTVIALGGAVLVGARALAADPVNQSTMSKRQMFAHIVDCMKKRMS